MQRIAFGLLLACINLGRGRSLCPDQSLNCKEGLQTDQSRTHVFKDGIPLLSSRSDLSKIGRPDEDHIHEVIFVIQSKNMDKLKLVVDDVSDPRSVNYSQHMTREQVVEMTSNPESSAAVSAYLQANGASIESVTLGGEFVTAHAPISVWERLLNTRFHLFEQIHSNGDVSELVRAEDYWISKEIHPHVLCAMNTVEIPMIHRWGRSVAVDADSTMNRRLDRKFGDAPGELHQQLITPARLRNYYNMSNSKGNSLSTQVVFAGNYGYFSPSRLRWFQGNVSKQSYQTAIIEVNDGFATDSRTIDEGLFSEANLDVQYIMAMSPGSPTTYWHYNDGIARFIRDLASKPKPSLICSISYGLNEQFMSPAEWDVFGEWILKASAMGVTVFVSAGDQGAVGTNIDGVLSRCKYEPSYPSANPYVVSVGASTGALKYTEEVVCAWSNGQVITGGGGFSIKYPRPAYQDAAVKQYFEEVARSANKPMLGYNANGRGYPDVVFEGNMYKVQKMSELGTYMSGTSGTSCTAPVAAGMFSNINAARMAIGKGPIGWVHPAMYTYYKDFVFDIVKGNNKDGPTCPQGFYATPGWDPASGLGSINYGKFEAVMVALGTVNVASYTPTPKPSAKPSVNPTAKPIPATPKPSNFPKSRRPTKRPKTRKPRAE